MNGNQREERVRMPCKMARQTLERHAGACYAGSRPYLGSGLLGGLGDRYNLSHRRIQVERETPVKRSDQDANNKFALHRRGMMLATAAAFFPVHGASGETGSRNAQPDVG